MTSKIIASGQRSTPSQAFGPGGSFKILASGQRTTVDEMSPTSSIRIIAVNDSAARCVRIMGVCDDAAGAESASDADARFDALDAQVGSLSGQVSTLQTDVATVSGQVSTLQTDVGTINGQVTTINGQLATQGGQITTLQGQVSTLQMDLTTLTGRVTALEAQAATAVRMAHREIADLFVGNTTALTPLLSYTIAANAAQSGDVFRIIVVGNYLNNTGGNAIFDIRFTVNALSELWNATATFPAAAGAHGFWVELDFAIHPDELQFLNGIVIIGNEAAPSTGVAGNLEVITTIAALEGIPGVLALNQDLELQVQFQHNVADANLILTRRAA